MATTPQYTRVLLCRDAAEQLWKELHPCWVEADAVPCWEPLRSRRAKGGWGTTASWCVRKSDSEMFAENLAFGIPLTLQEEVVITIRPKELG